MLIFEFSFVLLSLSSAPLGVHYKLVRCNFSEVIAFPNYSCFAKSFSRSVSTFNLDVVFRKPMDNFTVIQQTYKTLKRNFSIQVRAVAYYKYGTIYRDVLHTPMMDWCALMREETQNTLIKYLFMTIKDSFPEIIHECPYTVRIDFFTRVVICIWQTLTENLQKERNIAFDTWDGFCTNRRLQSDLQYLRFINWQLCWRNSHDRNNNNDVQRHFRLREQ